MQRPCLGLLVGLDREELRALANRVLQESREEPGVSDPGWVTRCLASRALWREVRQPQPLRLITTRGGRA